ncbi:MAG: hypothetical protein IT371_09200 [Deltaproteobacteria bacterium]|nr:hypothetical protein [Deltaproteobacteria bacterium]
MGLVRRRVVVWTGALALLAVGQPASARRVVSRASSVEARELARFVVRNLAGLQLPEAAPGGVHLTSRAIEDMVRGVNPAGQPIRFKFNDHGRVASYRVGDVIFDPRPQDVWQLAAQRLFDFSLRAPGETVELSASKHGAAWRVTMTDGLAAVARDIDARGRVVRTRTLSLP